MAAAASVAAVPSASAPGAGMPAPGVGAAAAAAARPEAGEVCSEMVVLPGGRLALGRYEVTVGEYRAFAAARRASARAADVSTCWGRNTVRVYGSPGVGTAWSAVGAFGAFQ